MLTTPLSPTRFTALALVLATVASAYCLAHGVVAGGRVDPALSVGWGLASTLPWCSAWEALKRVAVHPSSKQRISIALIAIAALASCALLQHALNARFYDDHRSPLEMIYLRAPLALGLVLAFVLIVERTRPKAAVQSVQAGPVAFSIPTRQGTIRIDAHELDYVRSAGNYVELATATETHLLRATLSELEAKLGEVGFERVHRSLLVNRRAVALTRRDGKGRPSVLLKSGVELPIGRKYLGRAEKLG